MNAERSDVLVFSAAVIAVTTAAVGCFPLFRITSNWAENSLMIIPGIVALALLFRRHQELWPVGWRLGHVSYWLVAIVAPAAVLAIALTASRKLGYVAPAASSTPAGALIASPLKLMKNIAVYTAVSVPLAFGEEIGWRGYAQPRLVRQFGLLKGLLLLGLVWGFWHTPIYYVMRSYPSHPFIGPFVMTPIDNILAVVPMAWLYIRSKNIWVPTFTHAFADVLWGFAGLMFPATQEIHNWAVLQVVQLIISAALMMDLIGRGSGDAQFATASGVT